MTTEMSDAQLQAAADFYGIGMEEARLRHQLCLNQGDDPNDPICIGCARRPTEMISYIDAVMGESGPPASPEQIRLYVIYNEGTYNSRNGHFLCDECYIRNGMPSSDRGWICP
jgi:hypothetical protein